MSEQHTPPGSSAYACGAGFRTVVTAQAISPVFLSFSDSLRIATLIAVVCMLAATRAASAVPPLYHSPEDHLAHEIKAAFLYQFGSYVEWPEGTFESEHDPLLIGVLGDEQVAQPLQDIVSHRSLRNRPIAMRRMRENDDPRNVHIFFIGSDIDPAVAKAAIARARGHPVLTVSESEGIGNTIITFVIEQDRVRFDVSLVLAAECGLRVSSRLLSVARQVEDVPP